MLFSENFVKLLDRFGCRTVLGRAATRYAKRQTGIDVEIFFQNGLWTHRVEQHYFPDSVKFEYSHTNFSSWKFQAETYLLNAKDFWLRNCSLNEGDLVIDVGAGHGEDTFAFSQAVGETGHVIAIEAHPLSFRILKEFCILNGLTNITLLHTAIMDKSGLISITESDKWYSNSIAPNREYAGVKIKSTTLDSVCDQLEIKEIGFLKMNIEGAEKFAILGMSETIKRVRAVCIACHDFRADRGDGEQFRTRSVVVRFLKNHGFKVVSRPKDQREYVRDHIFGLRCLL